MSPWPLGQRLVLLALLMPACRSILGIEDPIVIVDAANDTVLFDVSRVTDTAVDVPPGPQIVTFRVDCATGPTTANAVCIGRGFVSASIVVGHGWWQCAGLIDCPGGFIDHQCPTWCGAVDCVNAAYCGGTNTIQERVTDGAAIWNAAGYPGADCVTGNPGWIVRATCVP